MTWGRSSGAARRTAISITNSMPSSMPPSRTKSSPACHARRRRGSLGSNSVAQRPSEMPSAMWVGLRSGKISCAISGTVLDRLRGTVASRLRRSSRWVSASVSPLPSSASSISCCCSPCPIATRIASCVLSSAPPPGPLAAHCFAGRAWVGRKWSSGEREARRWPTSRTR